MSEFGDFCKACEDNGTEGCKLLTPTERVTRLGRVVAAAIGDSSPYVAALFSGVAMPGSQPVLPLELADNRRRDAEYEACVRDHMLGITPDQNS